ncbi:MAG TPA: triple tyrosine motif-containing protein, partial [Segetibacter sp.]
TSNTIYDLLQDEEKNVFVATNRGLNIYSPYSRMFNNYENVFRNLPDFGHPVYAIHELEDRNLLIGTKYAGAYYFNTQTLNLKSIPLAKKEEKLTVYHFTPFRDNTFLAGTSSGIHFFGVNEAGTVKKANPFKELHLLDTLFVTDILISNDSIGYIATFTAGLFKWNFKRHVLKQYLKNGNKLSETPVDNRLLDLSFTRKNNIIICTKNGFSIYSPSSEKFINFLPGKNYPYQLPVKNIKSAYDDGRYIWLSTYGAGVQRLDKQKKTLKAYTSQNGLPNDAVYSVLPDDFGRLWISTNNGLASLDPLSESVQSYTTQDGLPDNEFNAYAACKSNSGLIFYSTLNGIVSINPSLTTANPYNAKIVTTLFAASNGQKDTTFNTNKTTSFTLPAGFNAAIFKFAALSFAAPEKNNYKVKLEGVDKEWILLKNENEIRYPKLAPGKYTFVVEATNNNGKWSNNRLSVDIIVLPFWYQTWWFKMILIVAAITMLYTLYRYRIAQILKLEKFRRKISNDLHDDIGATLSSINIYAEMAKTEADNEGYLDTIQAHTINTINSLDDLVWSINPKNDSIDALIERMRSFAIPFLDARKIKWDFMVENETSTIPIPAEQRTGLYLAFKEMINNVVKHSYGTTCAIEILQKGKSFRIKVKDNGKGFNPNKINKQRNGLKNLKERALENNGYIEMISTPGNGATFIFTAHFK